MTAAERQAYQRELRAAAKRLGIALHGDLEAALVRYALTEIDKWIAAHGQPTDLSHLLDGIATSLMLEIVEIHSDDDLRLLLERIPPSREPVLARLSDELDDRTDAVILQRQRREQWERPYLAVINCRARHAYRKYFSKWHEVVHLILDGNQLRFAFRKTSARRKHPEEILVDKIAGVVAFYPPLFVPLLRREITAAGHLTFDVIERVRQQIAADASWESTVRACLRHCTEPVYFLQANLGYKRAEEEQLNDLLAGIADDESQPKPKLRVLRATPSPAVQAAGVRFHERMEVPNRSVVAAAFEQVLPVTRYGSERLETWQTSTTGPIGTGPIEIEAAKYGRDVWALVTLKPGAKGTRKSSSNRRPTTTGTRLDGGIPF